MIKMIKLNLAVEVFKLNESLSTLEITVKNIRNRINKKNYQMISGIGELQSLGPSIDCSCAKINTYAKLLLDSEE